VVKLQWTDKTIRQRGRSHERVTFTSLFHTFQRILELNNRILEIMAEMGDKLGGDYVFDRQYIFASSRQIAGKVYELIYNFNALVPKKFLKLDDIFRNINHDIEEELAGRLVIPQTDYVMPYDIISGDFDDVVGGKNANIAEIRNRLGMAVPEGFAVTTRAFRSFLDHNDIATLVDQTVKSWEAGKLSAQEASGLIMARISSGSISADLGRAMDKAVKHLQQKTGKRQLFLAVRSSGMGEDSEHTFAGQYLSLLNQPLQALAQSYKDVLASAYAPQAMEYRRQKGFSENEVAMAVACQCMVDAKVSGVLYSMDPTPRGHGGFGHLGTGCAGGGRRGGHRPLHGLPAIPPCGKEPGRRAQAQPHGRPQPGRL
jgi:pyruvate, water dikinase